MPLFVHQYITIYGIKNVVPPVGIILTIILWVETKPDKFIVYFLFCCQTGLNNKRLYQYRTNLFITIFCKTYHLVWTCIKVHVMCFDTLKKRG